MNASLNVVKVALSNTHQDMLWIEAWNTLYDLLKSNKDLILVGSEWHEISLGETESITQNKAYDSEKACFQKTWYRGKPAIQLSFWLVLK